ncbi:MAG: Uncharacterised protein [Flavobacteriia bacterium]|nr:MAG: Uncharacterised protein [Flavobacteriia bacterium]
MRYLRNFSLLASRSEGRALLNRSYTSTEDKLDEAMQGAFNWLLSAQRPDGGLASWYLDLGWTSSYPETTGYILPVLLDAGKRLGRQQESEEAAKKALEWLETIQHTDGGWAGGYLDQKRPPVVFNTGQVIRGMLAAHSYFLDDRWLHSAQRAGDWLLDLQDEDGSWKISVYRGMVRVYDTYVAAPLAQLSQRTGKEAYAEAARRQCQWVIREKQEKNAWFQDADNTIAHNDRPILHTLAYTIDGLIETGMLLGEEEFISAGERAAQVLLEAFLEDNGLRGRYDAHWRGSESFITTGGAQMSIAWNRLYALRGTPDLKRAFSQMNRSLMRMQIRGSQMECEGALFGSQPLWGRYEAFGCPNWASKYFLEALLMEDRTISGTGHD